MRVSLCVLLLMLGIVSAQAQHIGGAEAPKGLVCNSVITINQTAATDLKTFTNFGYICSVMVISATAQNLSLAEGTGTVCATGIAGLIGGTTASVAVAANGGFSAIGSTHWLKTQTSADHLCLLQSGTGNVSGVITYIDHP